MALLILDQLFLIGRDLKRWTSYTDFVAFNLKLHRECVSAMMFLHILKLKKSQWLSQTKGCEICHPHLTHHPLKERWAAAVLRLGSIG